MRGGVLVVADIQYDREASKALREEVIRLRDEALKQGDMEWSVKLSHVIGWMANAIDELWKEA